jgi:hypothetical protein
MNILKIAAMLSNSKKMAVPFAGSIYYSLDGNKKVSAGVYDSDGVKVATLFSMKDQNAGLNSAFWDGKDDLGKPVPLPGNYKAKILKSNISTFVKAVIGNSSLDLGGAYKHKTPPKDLFFTADKGYLAGGYSEHQSQQKQFAIAEPNRLTNEIYRKTTQSTYAVCVDSVQGIVYWAGNDPGTNDSWIFGTNVADNCRPDVPSYQFSAGVHIDEYNPGGGSYSYDKAIALISNDQSLLIKAFDVQQGSNKFLFVARGNILQTFNNTTGLILQTKTLDNPTSVRCLGDSAIWVAENGAVNLYSINSDGSLLATTKSIPCGTNAKIDVSPITNEIAIGDSTSFQVKFYNQSTMDLIRVFGIEGGINNTASVDFNKFASIDYVKFQPDGTFWVGDIQNSRAVHISNDFIYINQISAFDFVRCVQTDQTDITTLFLAKKEFRLTYSESGVDWRLVANWSKETILDGEAEFEFVVTLSNGIRYGGGGGHLNNLYKFTPAGTVLLSNDFPYRIEPDGNVYHIVDHGDEFMEITKANIIEFRSNGMPILSPFSSVVTSPATNSYTPWFYYNDTRYIGKHKDIMFFFNCWRGAGSDGSNRRDGFSTGAIRVSDNKPIWKSGRITTPDYQYDWPKNGDFNIGAGLGRNNTRGYLGRNSAYYNVNTEISAFGESNLWNRIHLETGLYVDQYGATGYSQNIQGLAGNALYNAVIEHNNKTYTFCADESVSGGALCFESINNDSLQIEEIPIKLSVKIPEKIDPTYLSASLPYGNRDFQGNEKWVIESKTASDSLIRTSYYSYEPKLTDIFVAGGKFANSSNQAIRGFVSNTVNNNWKLSLQLLFPGEPTIGDGNYCYLDILDQSQKLIARFQSYADTENGWATTIRLNGVVLASFSAVESDLLGCRKFFRDLVIMYQSEQLSCTYNNQNAVNVTKLDGVADLTKIGFIKVNQGTTGLQYHATSLKNIHFKNL